MELTQKEAVLLFGVILESGALNESKNSPPEEKDIALYQEIASKVYNVNKEQNSDEDYEKTNDEIYSDIEKLANKFRVELFKMKIQNK